MLAALSVLSKGKIIGLLPIGQRLDVEVVSRKWYNASRHYAWSTTYSLDYQAFQCSSYTPLQLTIEKVGSSIHLSSLQLRPILDRCGRYLRKVDLEAFRDSLDNS